MFDRLIRYALYETVFLTGAAVLIIEVAAVRILTPSFGSSLFVLSSVLSVVLAALSFGYFIGGKLSDKYPNPEYLYKIITVSGLATLTSEVLALRTLPTNIESGYEPLIFAFILFFLPAFLLGIVSPFVIKLQSLSAPKEKIGSVVGATFFFGTIGSIVGSLLTGFVLIPQFGVQDTMVGTGIALVALGIIGMLAFVTHQEERHKSPKQFLLFLLLVVAVTLFLTLSLEEQNPKGTLFKGDGIYSQILVRDIDLAGKHVRLLERDTNNSSGVYLDSFDLPFGYTQFAEFYKTLKPDTKDFLLIGGGAYTIPRTLVARDNNIEVDVSEIEPALFEIAQEYFDLSDTSRITNFPIDARVHLRESNKKYDVVFADAFGTDESIPFHLATEEFFIEIKEHLKPDGILMVNYIGNKAGHVPSLTGSLIKTVETVFPNVELYGFRADDITTRQNMVLIARNGTTQILFTDETVRSTWGETFVVTDLFIEKNIFNSEDELVLTDNHAPVEFLALKQ